jgi:hypothetical protein
MLPAVDVSTRGAKRDPNLKLTSADLCLQALNDYHTRSAEAGTECEQATWVFDVSKLTIKQVGDCFFLFCFCGAYLRRILASCPDSAVHRGTAQCPSCPYARDFVWRRSNVVDGTASYGNHEWVRSRHESSRSSVLRLQPCVVHLTGPSLAFVLSCLALNLTASTLLML